MNETFTHMGSRNILGKFTVVHGGNHSHKLQWERALCNLLGDHRCPKTIQHKRCMCLLYM